MIDNEEFVEACNQIWERQVDEGEMRYTNEFTMNVLKTLYDMIKAT